MRNSLDEIQICVCMLLYVFYSGRVIRNSLAETQVSILPAHCSRNHTLYFSVCLCPPCYNGATQVLIKKKWINQIHSITASILSWLRYEKSTIIAILWYSKTFSQSYIFNLWNSYGMLGRINQGLLTPEIWKFSLLSFFLQKTSTVMKNLGSLFLRKVTFSEFFNSGHNGESDRHNM